MVYEHDFLGLFLFLADWMTISNSDHWILCIRLFYVEECQWWWRLHQGYPNKYDGWNTASDLLFLPSFQRSLHCVTTSLDVSILQSNHNIICNVIYSLIFVRLKLLMISIHKSVCVCLFFNVIMLQLTWYILLLRKSFYKFELATTYSNCEDLFTDI